MYIFTDMEKVWIVSISIFQSTVDTIHSIKHSKRYRHLLTSPNL